MHERSAAGGEGEGMAAGGQRLSHNNGMKIVTYNLRFGGKGRVHWHEILEECDPKILLVQESYAPKEHLSVPKHGDTHEHAVWSPVESKGKTLKWGSGVHFPLDPPQPINLPDSLGGSSVPRSPSFVAQTERRDDSGLQPSCSKQHGHVPEGRQ